MMDMHANSDIVMTFTHPSCDEMILFNFHGKTNTICKFHVDVPFIKRASQWMLGDPEQGAVMLLLLGSLLCAPTLVWPHNMEGPKDMHTSYRRHCRYIGKHVHASYGHHCNYVGHTFSEADSEPGFLRLTAMFEKAARSLPVQRGCRTARAYSLGNGAKLGILTSSLLRF